MVIKEGEEIIGDVIYTSEILLLERKNLEVNGESLKITGLFTSFLLKCHSKVLS